MTETPMQEAERPLGPALGQGLRLRCPNCGQGHLLHSYLKVVETCDTCGEDFTAQRADDGPAYLTILIVGHVIIVFLHFTWEYFRPSPAMLALSMCALATVVALLVLPRFKGMIVAWQWAKRMHGFK